MASATTDGLPPSGPAQPTESSRSAPAPPAFARRNFGRSHAYYLNGQKLQGVTSIIRDGVPAPGLIGWAARTVAEYAADHMDQLRDLSEQRNAIIGLLSNVPNDVRDTAAIRGQDVHRLAELLHAGEDVDVPEHLTGHVDAYLRFLQDWDPRDELVERPVFSVRHRYAGTLDLIARLKDGKRWLIDLKTSRSGPYGEVALQLAAYRFAEWIQISDGDVMPMPKVDATGCVWITSDSYQFYPVTAETDQHRDFLYVQQVARWTKQSRSLVGSALEPVLL